MIVVKFFGGREIVGKLQSFDQISNMLVDDVIEYIRGIKLTIKLKDPENPSIELGKRELGLVFIKGTSVNNIKLNKL